MTFRSPWSKALALIATALIVSVTACTDDTKDPPDPVPNNDPNNMPGDVGPEDEPDPQPDVQPEPEPEPVPDVVEDMGMEDVDEPDPGTLCARCMVNDECGGPTDLCLNLPFEDTGRCMVDCTMDEGVCPEGYNCLVVQTDPAEVSQCVPEALLCNNPCEGVECGEGEVCNPDTGLCGAPLGLCDLPCITDESCGGESDQCVFLGGADEFVCARDCAESQTCPVGFNCVGIGDEIDGLFQCVPETLTCVERCDGVECPDGQICDVFTGDCGAPLGLCDLNCTNDGLCGGPDDLCISPQGNGGNESFCATACVDAGDCPLNFFCANLDNRELGVCVPLDITCVEDRCDDVDCGEGFNCDVRTGGCVEVEVQLCDPCGLLPSVACGGPDDLCLNLGDPGGVICSMDCSETGECPNDGYTCAFLNNTTRRACIPIGGDCVRCQGIDCPEGALCNPLTGECEAPPVSCLIEECGLGEVCNPDLEECEIINEPCNFDTRVTDCFGPVRKCSATRRGADGVCALICDSAEDCTPEAPNCLDLYRVGELCVPDGLGGPTTCGVTAPVEADIGRPCGLNVQTPCPPQANICIEGVEPDILGFCSTGCQNDGDCGGEGTCQTLRGREGRFCVPSNCVCLTGNAVPNNEIDILAQALGTERLGRCSFSLDPTNQRNLDPATPGAPLKPEGLGGLVGQPLSAPVVGQSLKIDLDAAAQGTSLTRDALVAAAARAGVIVEARLPAFPLPDEFDPLTEGIRAFVQAAGDNFTPEMIDGEVGAVPGDVAASLAQILAAAGEVVSVRQGIVDSLGLDDEGLAALFANTPYLFLPPAEGVVVPDLSDEAILGQLEDFDLAALTQAAADLVAVIEAADLGDVEGLDAVDIRVETSAGLIVIGGGGDTTWTREILDGPVAVLIDVSGNDTYRVAAGATETHTQALGLALDLGGDDIYGYVEVADERDQDAWLPSDADGRFVPVLPVQAGNGAVSLSDRARQGAGRVGVGLLFDLGQGADSYTSLRMSQGAGILGVGVLSDGGGDDTYSAEAFAQGAGLLGVGVLVDDGGNAVRDTFRVWHAGQGFGGARGAGLLYELEGDSAYTAEPAAGLVDVLYFSPPDRGLSNQNLAQGAGGGVLPADQRNPDRQALGGGFGALYDVAGADNYTSGTFAQGVGVHLAIGLLIDNEGDDTWNARYGAQGYGEQAAVGILIERAGNDTYDQEGRQIGGLMGSGNNLASGVFIELDGDDVYRVPNLSCGAATLNGAGVMFDLGGADQHVALTTSTWGYATTGVGEDLENPRRQVPTYGLFIDSGGDADTYDRIDLEEQNPPFIGDDRDWSQRGDDTNALELGIGLDGQGLTGLE